MKELEFFHFFLVLFSKFIFSFNKTKSSVLIRVLNSSEPKTRKNVGTKYPNLKGTALILIFSLLPMVLIAQQWMKPVNISKQGVLGSIQPSLCVDKNGNLHCAWTHFLNPNHWKIYYSHSEDDGSTWSLPQDVLQNDTLWPCQPKIIIDTNNILHLVYTNNCGNPSLENVYYLTFDGTAWSDPINLSEGYNHSYKSILAIDGDNRLYCFWLNPLNNYSIIYRYLENGVWSNMFFPYNDTNSITMRSISCDRNNNLQCIGRWSDPYLGHGKYVYLKYIKSSDLWSDMVFVTPETRAIGQDIAVDTNAFPHIVWCKEAPNSTTPYFDSTMYRYFDGSFWTEPQLITQDPIDQQIVIDNFNRPNIFDTEKSGDSSFLVRYYKYSDQWVGDIIDSSACYYNATDAITFGNKIYIVYYKCVNDSIDVFFTKSDMILSQTVPQISLLNYKVYPNPFHNTLTISLNITSDANVSVNIYSVDGKLISCLVNKQLSPGSYEFSWDGPGNNPVSNSSGLLLVRTQIGRKIFSRSVLFFK